MTSLTVPRMALAVIRGHAIFLDCTLDRYFALSPVENDALIRLLSGDPISERAFRSLTAATGIEATAPNMRAMLATADPTKFVQSPAAEISLPWTVRVAAIRHLFAAKVTLAVSGLRASLSNVASISTTRRLSPGAATWRFDQIVCAHEWLSRHVTANDACLLRSLALARHLRSHGIAAQLVIGVRPEPFNAHCWVQVGHRLLAQDLDDITSFEPILVVR